MDTGVEYEQAIGSEEEQTLMAMQCKRCCCWCRRALRKVVADLHMDVEIVILCSDEDTGAQGQI